ncbi:MAG: methyltransferase domain-containing protein, partial [Lentimicrobium sp.]|nr:methyltransferase domain-containing protein [Lentimicrobium sp.]
KMPPQKKILLEGRLQKRLRELHFPSFKQYIDYLMNEGEKTGEVITLFDLITTNKTDFFREAQHFDYLRSILKDNHSSNSNLKLWCAGCSSGEEAYTLSMVMSDFANENQGFDYNILATDISTRMLFTGIKAIYPEERVAVVPFNLKKKYLLKSKDTANKTVRIVPELRSKIKFERHNLMNQNFRDCGEFDIIFCRNVLIYFEHHTQMDVVSKLVDRLKKGGYLFLSHSETITYTNQISLKQVKPSVYIKI